MQRTVATGRLTSTPKKQTRSVRKTLGAVRSRPRLGRLLPRAVLPIAESFPPTMNLLSKWALFKQPASPNKGVALVRHGHQSELCRVREKVVRRHDPDVVSEA